MTGDILNTLFALAFAILLIAVFWSMAMYFAEFGSEPGKKEYKGFIIGSITWLFLLMCLFALVQWLRSLAGI